jgi:hypothetical protein
MVSRGEVGLIVAGVRVISGVLSTDIYTSIIRCYSIEVFMIHIDKNIVEKILFNHSTIKWCYLVISSLMDKGMLVRFP